MKKKKNTGNIMIILSLLLMITIGMYTILNSELFETKTIEIVGNTIMSDDEIIKKLDIKVDKNIFMYNTKKMVNKLKNNPYIEEVKVKRNLPNSLNITIKEKEIYAILRDEKDYCYVDNQVKLIEKIKDIEGDDTVKVDIEYIIEDNDIRFKDKEEKDILINLLNAIKECNLSKKNK